MKIKIIIPIYNDWQSAFKLFEEIDNLKIDKNFEISIIVVNDASTMIDQMTKLFLIIFNQ